MTDLTDEQLADLAAKAEAAGAEGLDVHDEGDHCVLTATPEAADLALAADPQTVAALVTEVVRRRAEFNPVNHVGGPMMNLAGCYDEDDA